MAFATVGRRDRMFNVYQPPAPREASRQAVTMAQHGVLKPVPVAVQRLRKQSLDLGGGISLSVCHPYFPLPPPRRATASYSSRART